MLEGIELRNKLKSDICKIILNSKSNLIFLIGENSTGKSDIGEAIKDKIIVLDNYTGSFDEIPKNEKVLVITHRLYLLLKAEHNTKVIITKTDDLYVSTSCDVSNYGDIIEMLNNKNILSTLLNNATSGDWSDLNEEYLQHYLNTHKITTADKLILKTIEDFKIS